MMLLMTVEIRSLVAFLSVNRGTLWDRGSADENGRSACEHAKRCQHSRNLAPRATVFTEL